MSETTAAGTDNAKATTALQESSVNREAVRGWVQRLGLHALPVWTRLLALLVLLAVIAWTTHVLDFIIHMTYRAYWKIAPPLSSIYVESPEVYTRERLINDRSTEEAWLNDQIARIDSYTTKPTIITRLLENTSVAVAPSEPSSGDAGQLGKDEASTEKPKNKTAADTGAAAPSLAFDEDFRLKSAYRSLVRHRMIENRLDDRHDLEGNSLYILKFDTTAFGIPAINERAVVKVRLLPPDELADLSQPDPRPFVEAIATDDAVFNYAQVNFVRWQNSLKILMNTALWAGIP